MKVNHVLLISLLVVGALFVPTVSAVVLYDESHESYTFTGGKSRVSIPGTGSVGFITFNSIFFDDMGKYPVLSYVAFDFSADAIQLSEGVHSMTYTIGGKQKTGRIHVSKTYNLLGGVTSSRAILFFDDWDIEGLEGAKTLTFQPALGSELKHLREGDVTGTTKVRGHYLTNYPYYITVSSSISFKNHILIEEVDNGQSIKTTLTRVFNGIASSSTLTVYNKNDQIIYKDYSGKNRERYDLKEDIKTIVLNSSTDGWVYNIESSGMEPPIGGSVMRTGSVTMTDHNGTSISGFEVTAVNYYTGQSYNVSTDTDVAVITLPMDRTVEIRNPQTGVYEEAPVGYYRFYGQKPGYKMLNEEGIKVSVMPEKYGTYKLCDILVSSDTGPLTGKHQFQLRSWSDNSILQTGTISAKSRTTGIWYNATVTNGIATLILPYDTSDAISEYAGHYYVYATSPGYEDIDYGVQIAVYPHTVSEVRSIHLYPIGGVLTPGNVTLRIQAISETGQSVANAEIFIAGVLGAGKDVWDTYTTSWTGFLEVSVPGNSTYDIVARGAGYYDSSRRIEVFMEDPPIIEIRLYLSGAPTIEPTTEPTDWVTGLPTTQPTGGIPDEDDDSDGFIMQAVRGIANLFGVSFGIGKTILGMLLALGIGSATAKHLRGGAQEFGMGMLGGVVLGVLIGLLPIWVLVLLVLIVGLWIGQRYMSGGES